MIKYKNQKKYLLKPLFSIVVATLLVFTVLMVLTPALAAPNENASDKAKDRTKVTIPENAVQIGPGVFNLGKSIDADGKTVQGLLFIDYQKEYGHNRKAPPDHGKGGDNGENVCFAFIAKGVKWKNEATWRFNPDNTRDLDKQDLFDDFSDDIGEWETPTGAEILGIGTKTTTPLFVSRNNSNDVFFGDLDDEGAIAAAFLWYKLGKPSTRHMLEFDIVFDDVTFDWSNQASGVAGKFDFNNLAMHEIGHALGMGHPDDSCTEETMYRFASAKEIKKRELNAGDIAGIQELYP